MYPCMHSSVFSKGHNHACTLDDVDAATPQYITQSLHGMHTAT